jgi:hypothetical protein
MKPGEQIWKTRRHSKGDRHSRPKNQKICPLHCQEDALLENVLAFYPPSPGILGMAALNLASAPGLGVPGGTSGPACAFGGGGGMPTIALGAT